MVEIVDTSSVGQRYLAEQDAEMRAGANLALAKKREYMNEEQLGRIVLFLKITGYVISGAIVWFYITKGIISFLPEEFVSTKTEVGGAMVAIGLLWPIAATFIANVFCHLITWIVDGKSRGLFGNSDDDYY